jgi:hypothetical protein
MNNQKIASMVFLSQKVKDIKVSANGLLENEIGILRRGLRKHSFIPGDKVPADLIPNKIDDDGIFYADIPGGQLSSDLDTSIHVRFPLKLKNKKIDLNIETVFSNAAGTRVDDGGNIQNMIINTVFAVVNGKILERYQKQGCDLLITIASSSDPFRQNEGLVDALGDHCQVFNLGIPDRFAIQLPWKESGANGTLAITSEPKRTGRAIDKLIETEESFKTAFRQATCIISSDPVFDVVDRNLVPPYSYIINSSTAFRSLVAAEAYNRSVILPMNQGEAADVCRLLLQRKFSQELDTIQRPPFPSPLTSKGDEIDMECLKELDRSVDMFRTFIPLHRRYDRMGISCPVTYGAEGGLLVGSGLEEIACFTSTPTPEREKDLLNAFGDPKKIEWDKTYEVGAGDAAATVISLFEAIDPLIFIGPYLSGRESEDRLLLELASIVYISLLSRLVGNFLVHNQFTNWSNIRPDAFEGLLDEAAQESLFFSRNSVRKLSSGPILREVEKWGIQVLVWRLGKMAYPERERGL